LKKDLALKDLQIPKAYQNLEFLDTEELKNIVKEYSALLEKYAIEKKELPEFNFRRVDKAKEEVPAEWSGHGYQNANIATNTGHSVNDKSSKAAIVR